MSNLRVLAAGLFATFFLTGCMVGPDYMQPVVDSPALWRVEVSRAADLSNTRWWHQFDDPVLNSLIDEALQNNKDLLIATARVDEFLGRYGGSRSVL